MSSYKVTPTNGAYNAPAIYVDAEKENEAEKKAQKLSGLSRFNTWVFIAKENKNAKSQRKRKANAEE